MSRASVQRQPREDWNDEVFLQAFQRLVGEVFRLNGELLRVAEALSRDLDMTPARWQVIAVVRNEPLTAAQIGRRLGLSRQAVQQTLGKLKKQGLVELLPNPAHQRAWLVGLSVAGRQVMSVLLERQVLLTHRFTATLGMRAAEVEQLAARLREMRLAAEASEPGATMGAD